MTELTGQPMVRAFIGVFFLTSFTLRGLKMLVALGALHLGADAFIVGVMATAFAVLPLILSIHAGKLADRTGPFVPILAGAITMAIALTLPILWMTLSSLFLSALLLGLGQIFIQVAVHNTIGQMSAPDRRARNYADLSLGVSCAAFTAPLLVGFTIDHFGFTAAFGLLICDALLVTAPVIWLMRRQTGLRARSAETSEGGPSTALFRDPDLRRVLMISGIAMSAVELFAFYLPIYANALGLSASSVGIILAANAVAAIVVRLATRSLLRWLSAMTLLTAALFVAAIAFALLPLFGNVVLLSMVSFLLGLGLGIASPLTISLTYETSPPGRSGEALGMRVLVNKVVQIAVPLAFGSIGTVVGVSLIFWVNAALLALGGALTGRRPG